MSGAASTWWGGIAKYIPTNTPITSLPFVTNFNVGQGTIYRINGAARMSGAWTNLSVQDILPTWKWLVQTSGTKSITPSFDFTDPYYGGSCLLVTGSLTANVAQTLKLYQTSLPISSNAGNATWLRVVFKPSVAMLSRMQVAVAFQDDPTNYQYVDLDAGATTYQATWNTKAFNLTGLFPGSRSRCSASDFSPCQCAFIHGTYRQDRNLQHDEHDRRAADSLILPQTSLSTRPIAILTMRMSRRCGSAGRHRRTPSTTITCTQTARAGYSAGWVPRRTPTSPFQPHSVQRAKAVRH